MSNEPSMGTGTFLSHFGEDWRTRGEVVPPIYQNSLFVFEKTEDLAHSLLAHEPENFHYSRVSNPTLHQLETAVARLEGCERAKAYSSGIAAIFAVVAAFTQQGSHVVMPDTAYYPSRLTLDPFFSRFGVTHTLVDGRSVESIAEAITPETSLIYLESPSSFLMRLQDLEAVAQLAKEHGIVTVCDNTYATPLFQQPAKFGIDLVVHSASKYLGGHSDLTAGIVCGSNEHLQKMISADLLVLGSALAPFPAWLVMRGMRSLKVRMQHAQQVGDRIARWLQQRPEVRTVHHPSLPEHPQHELFLRQMSGTSSLVSFTPKRQDQEGAFAFCDQLRLFGRGVSWGGHESLAIPLQLDCSGLDEPTWVIRLSLGLEDPEDLEGDLDQAFEHLQI